jgi:WXXGXW repeat (2 copies)
MGAVPNHKLLTTMGLLVVIWIGGCHENRPQAAANPNGQAQPGQPSSDPASVNLAPAVYSSGSSEGAAATGQNPPSPETGSYGAQPYDDSADESDYGVQPEQTAPEPPPPLPDYDQPPCPGDDYIWTPGYWDYASAGYYWVPGAWVQAPYPGALWTPGYWVYSQGQYAFFNGYWGPHIGFYGGINYGFGYFGLGYQGGYWRDGAFNYNRAVNNINISVVHHVYSYRIASRNVSRVSFNGGSGGVMVRPRPTELAALREPHAPPMRTQIRERQTAGANRAQFASVNHNRPQQLTALRPVTADRNVRPLPARGLRNLPPVSETERGPEPVNQAGVNRGQPSHSTPEHQQLNHPMPTPTRFRPAAPNQKEREPITPEHREAPPQPPPAPHHPIPERHVAPSHPAPQQRATPPASHPDRPEPQQPEHKEEHPHPL